MNKSLYILIYEREIVNRFIFLIYFLKLRKLNMRDMPMFSILFDDIELSNWACIYCNFVKDDSDVRKFIISIGAVYCYLENINLNAYDITRWLFSKYKYRYDNVCLKKGALNNYLKEFYKT